MSAHTPGPWVVDPEPQYDDNGEESPNPEFASYIRAAGDVEGGSVCGTCDGCNRIKMADARLIAAAPELLAALKDAREELRLCREKDWSGPYDPTLKGRIDAAIAKAEGKS